ncbi:TPA: hypothetical protein J4Q69_001336 [Escherichia coli]|uniref:hypothetical protein n=1 Tax=Escherichia coli TaxID=562 RepID=UPI0007515298|nr:hypothetical protein [Escherichia coli]EEU9184611.1 hypothetical protein [Escherichia coli]EFB9750288.1 hypothetical protein [Escherichia coli]EFH9735601.1 hypothetical protein [Escherichia coli]EFI5449642.1 hypothetical protein [Escherichia coli]EFJ0031281.1 hypothetical protein [Escherichia coli]
MCIYDFVANDGNTYQIDLDDEYIEVRLSGEKVGSISLNLIQNDDYSPDYYYITDLSLEKCKRLGIGRECLRLHQKEIKSPICAAEENSVKMSDGSHLIGDGVPFIAKMRDEGIVVPSTYH